MGALTPFVLLGAVKVIGGVISMVTK